MTLLKENLENLLVSLNGGYEPPENLNPHIELEFSEYEDVYPEGVVRITEYEANYAWYQEIESFGHAGFTFYGSHSSGGGYEAGLFAAHDGDTAWVDSTDHSTKPVIHVSSNGFVSGSAFESIVNYYRVFRRAYLELHGVPSAAYTRPDNPYHLIKWESSESEVIVCTFKGVRLVRV